MLTCKQCGSEIAENSRFCNQCGKPVEQACPVTPEAGTPPPAPEATAPVATPAEPEIKPEIPAPESAPIPKPPREPSEYCKKCGARLPPSCVFCLICGTKAGEEPPPPEPPITMTSTFELPPMPNISTRNAERKNSRLIVVCVFICVLLAFSAAAIWLVQAFPYLSAANKAKARGAVVYVVNGESLRYKTSMMSEPEEIATIAGAGAFGGNIARTSLSGQYIAYLDIVSLDGDNAYGWLYLRDFAKVQKSDSTEPLLTLISDSVSDNFFFTDNSLALVYLKNNSELVFTDFDKNYSIDEDITDILAHNDSLVLYSKKASVYGTHDLYLATIQSGTVSVRRIAENVTELCDYTTALDRFIYVRQNANGTFDLISCDLKQNEAKTLVIGYSGNVVAANASTFSLLYQTSSPNPLRYDMIIDDDLLRSDLKMTEPELEDYPMLEEFLDKYGIDADYEGSLEYEEIVDEKNRFEAAIAAYEQKLERDKLRDDITATIEGFVEENPLLHSLYYCSNGEVVKLADSSYTPFDDATLDMNKGYIIWPHSDIRNLKRVPISDYEHTIGSETLLQYISGHLSQNLHLQQLGHSAVPLYIGEGPYYLSGWSLTEKADGLYFAAGEGCPVLSHDLNTSSLYYAQLENGSVSGISMVDENVSGVGPILSGDRLLYYKDMNGGLCDLYLMERNSAGERIGDNVTVAAGLLRIENDGKTLFYFEHYNKSAQSGDLFMLTKQNRQLASDVRDVYYRTDALVYFLRGAKDGKTDLYSFGESGLHLVDSNVTAVMK